jgi:hypothetical protein
MVVNKLAQLFSATFRSPEGEVTHGTMMVVPRSGGGKRISFFKEPTVKSWRHLQSISAKKWSDSHTRKQELKAMGIVEYSVLPKTEANRPKRSKRG